MHRWFIRIRLRMRSLFRGAAVDASMRNELQVHLAEQIDEYISGGMTRDEAREAALRDFGPVTPIEEECRDARRVNVISNLAEDLRYTFRSLRRQPLLVLSATISIAIAIGANTTIFSLASELLCATPSASDPARLVRIRINGNSHVSYGQWQALEESHVLSGLAGYQIEAEVNWRGPESSVSLIPLIVTSNFFDVLGTSAALGRTFTARDVAVEQHPNVAVISHGFWQRRLGRRRRHRRTKFDVQWSPVHGAWRVACRLQGAPRLRRRPGGLFAAQSGIDARLVRTEGRDRRAVRSSWRSPDDRRRVARH